MRSKSGDRILLEARPRPARPAGERPSERRLAAAKLVARLVECRDWAPDRLRTIRLAALRQAVQSGTYRVDHEQTARAILWEIIGEARA
jgi:anti-sigma28 factor (negative regulator of flagellin synthesis)